MSHESLIRSLAFTLSCALLIHCSPEAEAESTPSSASPQAAVVAEVIFVVRVTGNGEDARVEVPLPISTESTRILEEEFRLRGFEMEESIRDDLRLAILTHPKLEGRRRFTYKALVALDPVEHKTLSHERVAPVRADLRRYTLPTPRLQSRSPLVREKLIEHLEPRLDAGEEDLIRMIYGLVAGQFERRTAGGTSSVLRAIRENHANDLGLDRLLVTFMRTAGIPARNVTGFKLRTDGGRKLERWTEIHIDGAWIPMSAPKGWYGVLPPQYLRMSHGERSFIERQGVETLSYKVLVREHKVALGQGVTP